MTNLHSLIMFFFSADFQQWRILCLVVGLVVILAAPVVSSWLPFYYTSSMAVGVFLVVLIIIFQVSVDFFLPNHYSIAQ